MKHARSSPSRRFLARIGSRRIALVAAVSLVVVLAGTTIGAFAYDRAEAGHLLPGTTIAGTDVGGMSRAAAVRAVRARASRTLAHPMTVRAGGRVFRVAPKHLGVTANVGRAVDAALRDEQRMSWMTRSYNRLFGVSSETTVRLTDALTASRVRSFVARVVRAIDRPARSAAMVVSADGLRVVKHHARTGRELDPAVAARRVEAALRVMRDRVRLPVRTIAPRTTDAALGATITVDLTTNTLRLWRGFRVVRTYPVATATAPYSTPVGRWGIVAKELHPVWINPGDQWSKSMPPQIPPGPSNPLGLRALRTSAPGILIHGTPEDWTVGTYASHGCIRMHEADALSLYPLVPVGTPVVIYGAPPWGASSVAGAPAGY